MRFSPIAADAALFKLVNGACSCRLLDCLMPLVTLAGLGVVQAALCLGMVMVGWVFERAAWRRAGYAGAAALLASTAAVHVGKLLWDRPRPLLVLFDVNIVGSPLFTRSFPSGHTSAAFAAAVACGAFLPRARWVLLPLATAVGLSRVYLGVHFPLDVIAGGLIGGMCGWAASACIRRGWPAKLTEAEPVAECVA